MRVVVIGAGVLGASAAYHLARAGVATIVIDDARDGRATAAGAGIICPWATGVEDPVWYRLYAESAAYYPALVQSLSEDGEHALGYAKVGALCVSSDPAELNAMAAHVRRRQTAETGAVSVLSAKQARDLFPPLRADLGAVHIAGAARVDGRLLADALLSAAARHGAQQRRGSARLIASDGRAPRVQLDDETIEADAVLVAAGAWARELLADVGVRIAIAPQRGQITHLRLPGTNTSRWPVVLPPSTHYLLAFDDSRVVVGATRESGAGFDYRVTAAGQAEVLNEALAVAPGLGTATLLETRIGFRPVGPDIRPLLGAIAGMGGLVIANGLGAGGLTMGPYAGQLLAQLITGQTPDLDLSAFDPLRQPGPAANVSPLVR